MTISDAKILIRQGAVSIDGIKITDINHIVKISEHPIILKVGKHKFYKIVRKI